MGQVIVALDIDSRAEAETLIGRLGDSADFYKIGYQLFYGGDGLALGKELLKAGKKVFFDLKLLDIDNTVERGVAAIAATGATMLTHRGEEGGLVISGQIEVTVGDQRRVLGPGDAYYFASAVPHRFRNRGRERCEIISASNPPTL